VPGLRPPLACQTRLLSFPQSDIEIEWRHSDASGGLCGIHPTSFLFYMVEQRLWNGLGHASLFHAGHQIHGPHDCARLDDMWRVKCTV
jgi:hypothetical protein